MPPAGRTVFAAAWIVLQAALILTAGRRPDNAFGFRMFSESSTLSVHLARRVDAPSGHGTTRVDVDGGAWSAHDRAGTLRHHDWKDRVHEPGLATFDRTMHASYGAAAQLARLEAALDDVAKHVDDDAETRALELEVTVRHNGRAPTTVTFTREVHP